MISTHIHLSLFLTLLLSTAKAQNDTAEIHRLKLLVKESELRATTSEKEAREYAARLKYAQQEAERMRYLALVNEVADQSLEIRDSQLCMLLALQAHNFNKHYYGYEFNKHVYSALQAAFALHCGKSSSVISHNEEILAIETGKDFFYSASSDGKIFKWAKLNDAWKGENVVNIKSNISVATFNIDGNLCAVLKDNKKIQLFDLSASQSKPKTIAESKNGPSAIQFSSDSKLIYFLGNEQHSINRFDFNNTEEIISSKEKLKTFKVSPNGKMIAGINELNEICLWNLDNNLLTGKFKQSESQITGLFWGPRGYDIFISLQSGDIAIMDTMNRAIRRVLSGHKAAVTNLVFSHSKRFIASVSLDKTIRVWNLEKLNERPLIIESSNPTGPIAFSHDDTKIIFDQAIKKNEITILPINSDNLALQLQECVKRNLTSEEWIIYIGEGSPYVPTVKNLPPMK